MVLGQNNLFKRWHRSDCVTYFTLCSLQFHFFYFPNTKKELMLLFSPFFFLPDVKWKICHGLLLEEAEKRVWSHSNLIWSQPPLLWTCTNMEGREGGGKKQNMSAVMAPLGSWVLFALETILKVCLWEEEEEDGRVRWLKQDQIEVSVTDNQHSHLLCVVSFSLRRSLLHFGL